MSGVLSRIEFSVFDEKSMKNKPVSLEQLDLINNTLAYFNGGEEINKANMLVMNLSNMGAGKTFCTLATYRNSAVVKGDKMYAPHLIVVCPVPDVWYGEYEKHVPKNSGYDLDYVITYETLAGKKSPKTNVKEVAEGLLIRTDDVIKHEKRDETVVTYTPSEKLKKMASEGIILVIDEVQKIKNGSSLANNAIRAITDIMYQNINVCRIMILSGTPFDKPEFATNILYALGVLDNHTLADRKEKVAVKKENEVQKYIRYLQKAQENYETVIKSWTLADLPDQPNREQRAKAREEIKKNIEAFRSQQILDLAIRSSISSNKVEKRRGGFNRLYVDGEVYDGTNGDVEDLIEMIGSISMQKYLEQIVYNLMASAHNRFAAFKIEDPVHCDKVEDNNVYLSTNNKDLNKKIRNALAVIQDIASYKEQTGKMQQGILAQLTNALILLEDAKSELIYKYILNLIEKNRLSRHVIFVENIETINKLSKKFTEKFGSNRVFTLAGENGADARAEIADGFRNGMIKILIASMKIASASISLHNLVDNRTVYSHIIPRYSILDIKQARGRTYRAGMMKDSTVIRNVYYVKYEDDSLEEPVIDRKLFEILAKKGAVVDKISLSERNEDDDEVEDNITLNEINVNIQYNKAGDNPMDGDVQVTDQATK